MHSFAILHQWWTLALYLWASHNPQHKWRLLVVKLELTLNANRITIVLIGNVQYAYMT